MKLDSRSYRLIFRIRRALGLRLGPSPIVWKGKPEASYEVPLTFCDKLNVKEKQNLSDFLNELKVISRIYDYLPEKLDETQWIRLVRLSSTRERFDQLKFYRKVENERGKDLERKAKRLSNATVEVHNQPGVLPYIVTAQKIKTHEQQVESRRLLHAYLHKDRPAVCVDCRFVIDHSVRGQSLTFQQLNHLCGQNRQRSFPWRLDFVNFDKSHPVMRDGMKRYLLQFLSQRSFEGHLTSKSYLDLYPKYNIIYLSPHTDNVLQVEELIDDNTCFVIGGIVDRVKEQNIHPEASAIAAQQEGVKLRRLPLDENVEWKAGKQLLTLTTVLKMLQDTYDFNGDWQKGLTANVPKRNLRTLNEKTPQIKVKYENIRQRDRAVLAIVHNELKKQKQPPQSTFELRSALRRFGWV